MLDMTDIEAIRGRQRTVKEARHRQAIDEMIFGPLPARESLAVALGNIAKIRARADDPAQRRFDYYNRPGKPPPKSAPLLRLVVSNHG